MSYDLEIYARKALDGDAMLGLLRSSRLEPEEAARRDFLTVNDEEGEYSFTLERSEMEPEDVPEELVDAVSGAQYVYHLMVEGSSAEQISRAIAFTRRLVAATGGAAIDHQTGEYFGPVGTAPHPPEADVPVDVLELHWYVRVPVESDHTARAWAVAAQRELPEVFPRRYNTYEPMGRARSGGEAGVEEFVAFVRAASDTVYFTGESPASSGSIARPSLSVPEEYRGGPFAGHNLTLLADPFRDVVAWSALKRLFVEFAREVDAVVATAEVRRGLAMSGRRLGFGVGAEDITYLTGGGQWHGLPPYPMVWTWFGREYAPLVRDSLPDRQVEIHGDGLMHTRADLPTDRDALIAQLPKVLSGRRWFRRRWESAPWLPADLLLTEDRSDPAVYNPPKTRARVVPHALT